MRQEQGINFALKVQVYEGPSGLDIGRDGLASGCTGGYSYSVIL